jgi:hypothetical protein
MTERLNMFGIDIIQTNCSSTEVPSGSFIKSVKGVRLFYYRIMTLIYLFKRVQLCEVFKNGSKVDQYIIVHDIPRGDFYTEPM